MNNYVNVTKMSITLDNVVAEELNSIASELNEKKSHLIQKALMYYFDALDESLADRRLKALDNKEVEAIPAEEVWKELGL
ncbi:MAG: CopG family transcriptional regulator [Deltaproteobacteria bacterium]|nr:CopG family transcriptional regulator [Deltaproteobacteria bacterium]